MRDLLRDVNLDGYRLRTWDINRVDHMGKCMLAYELDSPDGTVLFAGEDFACSLLHAIDSDETLRGLLSFLTLRPGDTDAEYFAEYTTLQMEFARGGAESLSLYAMEADSEEEPLPAFIDWREEEQS